MFLCQSSSSRFPSGLLGFGRIFSTRHEFPAMEQASELIRKSFFLFSLLDNVSLCRQYFWNLVVQAVLEVMTIYVP